MGIKLKPYPEYKESGVPWLGKIPVDWRALRSRYVFREVDSRSTTGAEEHLSMSQQHGLIPSSRLSEHRLLSESYLGGKLCERGDIVLNRLKAHLGVFAAASQPGVISPDYTVLRPKQQIAAKYFEFLLRTPLCRTECAKRVKGVVEGFWRLYTDSFYSISLPMPPFETQEGIVNYLQSFDRILGRLIRLKRRMIDLLTEQKQAIIHRAVTRGIDPNVRLKPSGIDWLGDVPAHWRANSLKHSALLQTGTTLGKNYADSALIERPYVRVANVQNGFISTVNMASVRLPEAEALRCELREGDVLMTEGGDIDKLGRGAVWHSEIPDCLHQNHVFAVRCKLSILLPDYLVALMMSNYGRTYFQITAKQTTNLASTNSSTIKSFPIVIPEVSEQRGILAHIANKTASIDAAISKTTKDIDLLREYRTRLIADVVTGKLDVRGVALPDLTEAPAAWDDGDPTEEPPEEESAPED